MAVFLEFLDNQEVLEISEEAISLKYQWPHPTPRKNLKLYRWKLKAKSKMKIHHIVWIYCLQLTFGQPHLLWQYGYNDKEQRKDDNDDTIWENLIKYVQASDRPQCSKYSNVCQDQIEKVETIWKSDYHIKHQIHLWENTVMMKCHFVHFTIWCHYTKCTHFDGGVSFRNCVRRFYRTHLIFWQLYTLCTPFILTKSPSETVYIIYFRDFAERS